jgi:hypothetical protein
MEKEGVVESRHVLLPTVAIKPTMLIPRVNTLPIEYRRPELRQLAQNGEREEIEGQNKVVMLMPPPTISMAAKIGSSRVVIQAHTRTE